MAMMEDLFTAGLGFLALSKEKTEEMIEYLVSKGDMKREEAKKLVNRLMEKGKEERERMKAQIKERSAQLARERITREDLERIEAKLDKLLALVKEKLA